MRDNTAVILLLFLENSGNLPGLSSLTRKVIGVFTDHRLLDEAEQIAKEQYRNYSYYLKPVVVDLNTIQLGDMKIGRAI